MNNISIRVLPSQINWMLQRKGGYHINYVPFDISCGGPRKGIQTLKLGHSGYNIQKNIQ